MSRAVLTGERPAWHSEGPPCAQADPEAWFPEFGHSGAAARQVCASCPHRARCLEDALRIRPTHGIWAGYTARELAALASGGDGPARTGRQPVESTSTCRHGHPRELTYRAPSGRARCRACESARRRARRARLRGAVA